MDSSCRFIPAHFALIPAALMIGHHFSVSALCKAPRDEVLSHAIREVVLFGVTFMFWNGSTMNAPASSRQ